MDLELFVTEIVQRELKKYLPNLVEKATMISAARSEAAKRSWEKRKIAPDLSVAEVRLAVGELGYAVRRLRDGAKAPNWGTWIAFHSDPVNHPEIRAQTGKQLLDLVFARVGKASPVLVRDNALPDVL